MKDTFALRLAPDFRSWDFLFSLGSVSDVGDEAAHKTEVGRLSKLECSGVVWSGNLA